VTATTRPYSGRTREERDADRLERLRAATLELFGTQGYAAVSVERLCTAAKVSTRNFYQFFGNKEDILLDVYSQVIDSAMTGVAQSLEETADAPIEKRIRGAVGAYLASILSDPRKARISFIEVVGVSARVEERRRDFRQGIIALLEEEGAAAVARGEITAHDFKFAGLAFIGAVNSVVYEWTLDTDMMSVQALEKRLADLLVGLATQ
jgi:AcrR family transcriptional regulator